LLICHEIIVCGLRRPDINGLAYLFIIIFQAVAFQDSVCIFFSCNEVYIILQINGVEKKSIRLPRQELDNLTHDDAVELALSQSDLQRYTSNFKIVNTAFTVHPSYEAVINIKTERVSKVKQDR
jgi:hypothetical protein